MINEPKINKSSLIELLKDGYSLDVSDLTFIPVGDVSFSYKVSTTFGENYFLKLIGNNRQMQSSKQSLERTLSLTTELHGLGINNIPYPIKTTSGLFKLLFEEYSIILYHFIDGKYIRWDDCSKEVFVRLTQLLAEIHKLTPQVTTPLPREDFKVYFYDELIKSLNELENYKNNEGYKKKLAELLLPIKEKLLKQLEQLIAYSELSKSEHNTWVLTHTDPTPANLLLNKYGEVYILDWEGAKIAPLEHDFMFFLGDLGEWFKLFLKEYEGIFGKVHLSKNTFAFYLYRRYLEDLTDWVVRILYENQTDEQNEKDIRELTQDCLIDYEDIEQRIENIGDFLQNFKK